MDVVLGSTLIRWFNFPISHKYLNRILYILFVLMMSKSFCICSVMFSSVLAATFALLFGWLSTFSVYCTGFFCRVVLFELFLTDLLANASTSHPTIREVYLLEESEYPLNALRIRFIIFVIFIFSVTFIARLKFIYFFSFFFVYVEVFTFCSTIVFVGIWFVLAFLFFLRLLKFSQSVFLYFPTIFWCSTFFNLINLSNFFNCLFF